MRKDWALFFFVVGLDAGKVLCSEEGIISGVCPGVITDSYFPSSFLIPVGTILSAKSESMITEIHSVTHRVSKEDLWVERHPQNEPLPSSHTLACVNGRGLGYAHSTACFAFVLTLSRRIVIFCLFLCWAFLLF